MAKDRDPVVDDSRKAAQEDARFRLLQALEQNPEATQRELAAALGLSLGAVNYSLKALGERGLVKLGNFTRSDRKLAYAYILTPAGLSEKAGLARRFMARKREEYEALREELEVLRAQYGEREEQAR
ncbi:MAG: MarR family EPS-associated transcriptional regulator [Proteobacteria bacterium]|nr:MarR family EPS-associated transcriptional regulator [Pseudomonadota bacterium]